AGLADDRRAHVITAELIGGEASHVEPGRFYDHGTDGEIDDGRARARARHGRQVRAQVIAVAHDEIEGWLIVERLVSNVAAVLRHERSRELAGGGLAYIVNAGEGGEHDVAELRGHFAGIVRGGVVRLETGRGRRAILVEDFPK